MPLNFDGEEEDMKEGLKPEERGITWPLEIPGVEYAGVFSQYAEECGAKEEQLRPKTIFSQRIYSFQTVRISTHCENSSFMGWLL